MSADWRDEDPFVDPDDPRAREREERRLAREEKRRRKEEKEAEAQRQAPPPPPPPPPEPAKPERTPEQEFWDEDPEPEPPAAPGPESAPESQSQPPEPEPEPEPVVDEPPQASEWDWGDVDDEGDPEMAGAAGAGGRGDGGGGRRGGFLGSLARHPFRIAAVILAVVVLWFLDSLFQPFHGDGSGKVRVAIPKGSGVSEVGDLLGDRGVIDSSTLFQVRVTLAGKRSDIYPGRYTLAHGMSYGDAIDALSEPPVKRTLTVTIPEGYARPQAAQLVSEDGVPGSYVKATKKSKYLKPAQYGGKKAKNLEGFLFPDTFELKPKAPVADLVELQLKDFKRQIKKVEMKYAKSKNLTAYDVLTIASMVEDEAGVPGQRKLVASVIYNRLHEGMPLGIDATIRFATGNYSKPLTESQLATDSPYNTRTNTGLPPGPINSPGLEAIQAAAHPKRTKYLFYVTAPDTCGKLTFAKTEAEFEAAVNRYNKAREEAGGNSPDSCGE